MNTAALAALGQSALAWAKCYSALKTALMAEGVPSEEAAETAKDATNVAALWNEESGEPCPLCGRET